jgi:hypothetical protein
LGKSYPSQDIVCLTVAGLEKVTWCNYSSCNHPKFDWQIFEVERAVEDKSRILF